MDYQLNGKTALISGSTAGIGCATATLLAAEGASVVINGRTNERVENTIQSIQSKYPKADLIGIAADLSTAEGIEILTQKLPKVDILVNSLGIYNEKDFMEIEDEEWFRFFETNVMSGVRLSRFYFPKMLKQNWGRIIFISSESGVQISPRMIHYGMTKAAQLAISRGLAEMTEKTNVTVNTVIPGPTTSEGVFEFIDKLAKEHKMTREEIEKEMFIQVRPTSILKRFTTVEEIAALIVYLCSPLSSGSNGAALRVDGGIVRSMI